jgi:diphthamide biosynthesis methyltransferase
MVLYLVGLGLGDEKDVTVRGLEAIKQVLAHACGPQQS